MFSSNPPANNLLEPINAASMARLIDQPLAAAIPPVNPPASPSSFDRQFTGSTSADTFRGTTDNDQMIGLAGNDTFFSSFGNDLINGGDGSDIYQFEFAAPIVLEPMGMVDKGVFGRDQLIRVDRVNAFPGEANMIDGSSATGSALLNIDLVEGVVSVENIPGLNRPLTIQVSHFVNAIATNNNDTIRGNDANNILDGRAGNDIIFGGNGNDIILGRNGNDILSGDAGNDFLAATDSVARGRGEIDIVSGGLGSDRFILGDENGAYYRFNSSDDAIAIADFSNNDLLQIGANTLYQTFRTDNGFSLFVVENNTIEIVGLIETSEAINLPTNPFRLAPGETLGIFVGGSNDQRIIGGSNTDRYNGTATSDHFVTQDGRDLVYGSEGNDIYDGGAGIDTMDYSTMNIPITVFATGIVDKGVMGQDQLIQVERIIGTTGQSNTIAASNGSRASVNINLAENTVNVFGISNIPNNTLTVTVENFSNAIGTRNRDLLSGNASNNFLDGNAGNDLISGNAGDDIIFGSAGSDLISGGVGNDWLNGTNSTARGRNERDALEGGTGSDRFILGDATGGYYTLGSSNDFVQILDFDASNDVIELGRNELYTIERDSDQLLLFSSTNGQRDLVAQINYTNSLPRLPLDPFSLDSGEVLSFFIGA